VTPTRLGAGPAVECIYVMQQRRRAYGEVEREVLLGNLKNQQVQWTMLIPKAAGDFCGKRIRLSVLKKYPWGKSVQHPPLSPDEIALLKSILARLPASIAKIEGHFASEITPKDPTFIQHAEKPMIWISREEEQNKGRYGWTFCVGRDDDPEPHLYFEFKRDELVEVYGVR
jgi:hypothetical protein